jgi:hypothetical protein
MSGKGSKQRPLQVPPSKFSSNWDLIFSKPKKKEESNKQTPANNAQKA